MQKEYKEYWLFGGMGGGFGGPGFLGTCEAESKEQADQDAYEAAVEEYQSYEGSGGVASENTIAYEIACEMGYVDEDEVCEEDFERDSLELYGREVQEFDQMVQDRYNEEIEGWISYWSREAIPGVEPDDYLANKEEYDK